MSKTGYHCVQCGDIIPRGRAQIGYTTCMTCGESHAKKVRMGWTIAPYTNKGAYMLITDAEHLKQINPKRTI